MTTDPQAEFQRALALHQSGRVDAAEKIYKSILLSHPKDFNAIYALGIAYLQRKDFRLADRQFSLALKINPNNSPLHNNHGNALLALGRVQDALAAYDKAIALDSWNWEAHYNRGNALSALSRFEDALASYDKAIALNPNNAEVHDNRGTTLARLRRYEDAIASFDRSIRLNPNRARAYANRANAGAPLKKYEEALNDYDKAFDLDPDLEYLAANRLQMKLYSCRWDGYEQDSANVIDGVRQGTLKADPFTLLSIPATAADQLKCAIRFVREKAPPGPKMPWHGRRYSHDRIRVGYVSSGFHDHATSHLMTGMFETHDRLRFMIHGFSTGSESNDSYRQRIANACEVFVDARTLERDALIQRILASEIDILIDVDGLASKLRAEVFAQRPAPIQVNYLGYPGTMGASYIDYIIADRHVIPEADQVFYSEKVVYLPDSYQPNDRKRPIAENVPARVAQGLPESGFVFCSFNDTFKITPDVFDIWMRLLAAVDGSVLWLFCENAAAAENLRAEAKRRNIAPERLVFAGRIPADEHRARHKLADLFLDTLYCNAHTTASDALWAGLPLITCPGSTFTSRVAASLLHAVGLPELIANSPAEYEALALKLATDPRELQAIKSKLAQNRLGQPLFDTERYTRNIEAAYTQMWTLHQKGKSPRGFAVEEILRDAKA